MDLIQKAKNLGCIIKNDEYYLWEIQKWLREKHNILAYVTPYMNKNPDGEFKVTLFRLSDHFRMESFDGFETHEEAFEKGLQEALKLIK